MSIVSISRLQIEHEQSEADHAARESDIAGRIGDFERHDSTHCRTCPAETTGCSIAGQHIQVCQGCVTDWFINAFNAVAPEHTQKPQPDYDLCERLRATQPAPGDPVNHDSELGKMLAGIKHVECEPRDASAFLQPVTFAKRRHRR